MNNKKTKKKKKTPKKDTTLVCSVDGNADNIIDQVEECDECGCECGACGGFSEKVCEDHPEALITERWKYNKAQEIMNK